jgi:hypothetical protein
VCATRLVFVSVKTSLPAGTFFRESLQARAVIFTVTFVGLAGAVRPSSEGPARRSMTAASAMDAARGKRRRMALVIGM